MTLEQAQKLVDRLAEIDIYALIHEKYIGSGMSCEHTVAVSFDEKKGLDQAAEFRQSLIGLGYIVY